MKASCKEIEKIHRKAARILKRRIVLSSGSYRSKIMLVGEAPGRFEMIEGKPFAGSAGKILDAALHKAGLSRNDVYITNVVLWRPPDNRRPLEKEIGKCFPYLLAQIRLLKPEIVCTLGNTAVKCLLKRSGISKRRGKIVEAESGARVKILPTYHPAAVLYSRKLQRIFEEDVGKLAKSRK